MGRSVSYATGAAWVLYTHLEHDEGRIFVCRRCDHEHERDDANEPDECAECGNVGFTSYERYSSEDAWSDFVANLRAEFKRAFPSLGDCDEWLDREDHALLENRHAYVGVSEYCGLVSVWCKAKDSYYGDHQPLAHAWAVAIKAKAERTLDGFADRLYKVATFSNGEAVFQRARA
ncbi:hypothetical protein [uncultured Xanthomonas sp.]|uniref:hypothetical protein n=1 Tax=uncultured Xanthomonas sp. TaxID=152831 RepID=UPI0025D22402|nr:hypothetical protein [uncultured Xanthomonas sp.]